MNEMNMTVGASATSSMTMPTGTAGLDGGDTAMSMSEGCKLSVRT